MRVEILAVGDVPEEHRKVFLAMDRWEAWWTWVPSKHMADEGRFTRDEALAAARWLASRVFVAVGTSYSSNHGVVAERGRWTCVSKLSITPGLSSHTIVDLRGEELT